VFEAFGFPPDALELWRLRGPFSRELASVGWVCDPMTVRFISVDEV
jgi:hypothetical protein